MATVRTRHPFPDVTLEFDTEPSANEILAALHPDAEIIRPELNEFGTEIALGFMPHQGENRTTRRAAVANFEVKGVSRRELLKQRQRQRRGKLDPELRRLQRKALKK